MKILVFHPGTQHVFQLAKALHRHGLLHRCAVGLVVPERWMNRIPFSLQENLRFRLANRMCPELEGRIVGHPLPELACLAAARLGIGEKERWWEWRNRLFGRWVARNLNANVDAVWGFDSSSVQVFRAARDRGLKCILEMSAPHPLEQARILRNGASQRGQETRNPHPPGISPAALASRLEEMELADAVSVGSAFAARSLIRFGVQPAKVFVTPYGVDLEAFTPPEEPKPRKKPVFLYAGGFRREKGVHDLLAAWRTAHLGPRAGLWLAGGDRRALDEWQGPLPFGVRVLGRLSRSALAEAYRRADVFVFPTWFEGLSLAVLEAMASGLPVLTTTRSGVADRIENGRNGFLFRPGDRATLTRRLREMAASPQRISEMGAAARKTAENDSWDAYAQGCVNIARSLCVDRSHETTLSDSDHPLEPILGSARLECRLEKGR